MTGEHRASRSARGVYGISVAAELSGIGPQTLRLYERSGLLSPARTAGGTRRYSDDDIEQLRRITELVEQGVNLAGIAQILHLQDKNSQLKSDNSKLEARNAALEAEQPSRLQQDETAHHRRRRGPGRNSDISKHPAR
ncbi:MULTISPECIES: heat shock protein transcriptional repressor HspR [Mycobacteriaceae]|uniref:heat shock protein transcriptional repressor HspR n=1 Tax=Mycobacteriaceae TaxID=1762 RepID=UPI0007EA9E93|nr:helix-turn-helix transcriptional regulator [Mycobacterium sp. 852013-50091_SCH5140682]OBC10502.1 MerR family transcriptional regulator [Mycobacterium sp. 852013-50091_SCH5140682]